MAPSHFYLVVVAVLVLGFLHCEARDRKHPANKNKIEFEFTEEDFSDGELEDVEKDDFLVGTYAEDDSSSDSTGDSQAKCGPASRNTDEYIDKVLTEVRPKLPEPAFLPDRVGRFRLFNGTLSNLMTLERTGPALVRCSDSTFSFLVPIGMRNITGKYFWETDAGVPVFRGFIDMFIRNVEAEVLYTRKTSEYSGPKARVDRLKITRLEGVEVNFDGLGPLSRFVSRLSNLAVRFFGRGVARALEGPVRTIINKELENVEKYEYYY